MGKRTGAWWWIDRWRKSSAYTDFSLAEQGAYRNLLDELWLRDGLLPLEDRVLAKISGDALEWPKLRDRVMARFERTKQGWRHETHDEVSAGTARLSQTRAVVGSVGGSHSAIRKQRLKRARERASHTADEWVALVRACRERCVKCGRGDMRLEPDHIIPLYQEDSEPTDGIDNVQPMCAPCNTGKGPESVDFRPNGWRSLFAEELSKLQANRQANSQAPYPYPYPLSGTETENEHPPDPPAPAGGPAPVRDLQRTGDLQEDYTLPEGLCDPSGKPRPNGKAVIEADVDALAAYAIRLGGHPSRRDRRAYREALRAGHQLEQLRGEIAETVKAELVRAGTFDWSASWPPAEAERPPPREPT